MKKLFTLFALIIVATATAMAQDSIPQQTIQTAQEAVATPETLAGSFTDFYISLAALLPLITFIAAWLNKKINSASSIAKQATAWAVAIALSYIGWFFKIGIFENLTWWHTLIYGAATGLAANGFFDIKMIQSILGLFSLGKIKR